MALWFLLLSQSCQPPIFTISAISKQKISAKLTRFHCRNYSSGLTTLFLPSSLTFISLQHPFLFPSITQNYTSLYQDYEKVLLQHTHARLAFKTIHLCHTGLKTTFLNKADTRSDLP
jgi:hypothetical protein